MSDLAYWYMSFVDAERDVFLGSAVVQGRDEAEAMTNSHKAGVNPGGEVAMILIPNLPPEIEVNHYYSLAEMLDRGYTTIDDLGPKTRAARESAREDA